MKAKSLNILDVLVENSKSNDKVILQISYDDVDEKNHKSLNTISHMMGYKQRLKNLFKSIHSLLTKRLTLSKVKILR